MTPPRWGGIYAERSCNVASLGYASYNAYLASEKWAEIRARILAKPECYACGFVATQVHHSRYTREALSGHDDSKLYAVCGKCHEWAHNSNGHHLCPDAATARLRQLRRKRERMGQPSTRAKRRAERKARRWLRNRERQAKRSPLPVDGSVFQLLSTSYKPIPLYDQFRSRLEREA